jgi:hypothetical protein
VPQIAHVWRGIEEFVLIYVLIMKILMIALEKDIKENYLARAAEILKIIQVK